MLGMPHPMKYGWSAGSILQNISHPQIQAIYNIYHSLVLGAEGNEHLANMSTMEIQDYTLGIKNANLE